jgi:phytoene dehydrogenase-like protein
MSRSLEHAEVVVVGAGLGGLCTAAYLAVAGKRVIVVDRHSVPGGNGTVFTHDGFEFDVGLHYIGDCGPGGGIPSVLEPLGIELTYREMDPDGFDTFVFDDGTRFAVPKGVDTFRDRLVAAFPGDADGIRRYLDTIVAIDDELTGAGPGPAVVEHLSITLGQLFDDLDLSPRARTVLSGQHGTYALPPSQVSLLLHAALVMHYLKGAYYPTGGGQVIADRLAEVIRSHGGDIVLQTPVEEILVEDTPEGRAVSGVRLHVPSARRAQGVPDVIRAPVVVSNADLKATVTRLLPAGALPPEVVAAVEGYEMTLPLFVLYLIIDRDLSAELPNTNLWLLGDDVEEEYAGLFAGHVSDRPMTYITSASLKDPGNPRLCGPGQTNVQIMTLVPGDHEWWGLHGGGPAEGERYRTNPAYLARKRELRDLLVAQAERVLPGIEASIVHEEAATPITHERFVRSTGGTSYGIAATPGQFALNRPANATALRGLFLVGASTMSGHGIGGVLAGGLACAGAVLGGSARSIARERLAAEEAAT